MTWQTQIKELLMHLQIGVVNMKILFIHNIIAPYRTFLFEALAKKYQLMVVFLEAHDTNRKWDQKPELLDFKHAFVQHNNYTLFGKKITLNKGLLKIFDDFQPDVLVTIDNPPNFLTTIRSISIARKRKIPIILWTGAFGYYKTIQKNKVQSKLTLFAIKSIRKYIYSKTNMFWAYSLETENHLQHYYQIDKNKIKIGLQGYPDELIHCNEIDFKKRFSHNKLLFIGSLERRKGIELLINVFENLRYANNHLTLEIVGDGSLYEGLKSKYKNTTNIIFKGYLNNEEKFDLLNQSKYLILPSQSDPWGWVVQEASSCKIPALVSDSVMAKEIVSDEKLVFETNSINDLSMKLKILLQLNFNQYLNLSEKVYENSRHHTLNKALHSFNNIIKEIK